MKNLNHYMIPKLTEQLYEREARSSIALTKVGADKINEVIDAVNNLYKERLTKYQEQDGKIQGAILYMKDNIANSIYNLLEIMKSNGELFNVVSEACENQVSVNSKAINNITKFVTPEMFGAKGDGVKDDTQAINLAFDTIKQSGGVLEFTHGKHYLVSGTAINMNGVSSKITINGNNATLIQKNTGVDFKVIYYNANLIVNDLIVKGCMETGMNSTQSFGFYSLSNSDAGYCVFNNCKVYNFSCDGWYHKHGTLVLNNCISCENYRNDVSVVGGAVIVNGGVFGSSIYNESVACIDIEPNENSIVDYVEVNNAIINGRLQIIADANNSKVRKAKIKNVTIDNANTHGALHIHRIDNIEVENLIELNNPVIRTKIDSVQENGLMVWDKMPLAPNLLAGEFEDEWENAKGTSDGVYRDEHISYFKGKNLYNAGATYNVLKRTISVEPNTIYTMGCMMLCKEYGGVKSGMFVDIDGVTYNLKNITDAPSFVSREIYTGDNTSLTIMIGANTTQVTNLTVAKPFLVQGKINKDFLLSL